MLSQVRAATPKLLELTAASRYASAAEASASTHYEKKAHLINLDGVNSQLVEEVMKLGSSVLKSLEAAATQESLARKGKERDSSVEYTQEKESSLKLRDALILGGGIAAVPALAANYTINKASEDLDAKMLAIPGIAAATVGAILAARNSAYGDKPLRKELTQELEGAINAKEVIDSALESKANEEVSHELAKMSSVNTDHIAQLVTEILA